MRDETVVAVAAIAALAALGAIAIAKGIDSGLLTAISSIIGGLAGYRVGRRKRSGR